MVTIRDVALRAGVSRGTVSRYFNHPELVSKRAFAEIESAIQELSYVVDENARRLAFRRAGRSDERASDLDDRPRPDHPAPQRDG